MPILSRDEVQEKYESTLQYIANVSLFQYTFILTICYTFVSIDSEVTNFLRLPFSRFAWATISNLGAVIINTHISRQLNYLRKLTLMYPQDRKKLRFLIRHHRWLFNPFKLMYFLRTPIPSMILYFFALTFPLIPSIHMLDSDLQYQQLTETGGYDFWFTYITVSALGILHSASIFVTAYSVIRLGNVLWKDQLYSEKSRGKLKQKSKQPKSTKEPRKD